jgi:hypothetical protein
MSDTEPASHTASSNVLAALAQMPSDPTGAETFARYLWQAKQAVRQWLTCLSSVAGPAFVVCEHVEDTVLVYPTNLRFVQLKTRERGSWSAYGMCDEGLDSLAKSYSAAYETNLHKSATFELWLEGPISNARDTTAFVTDPTQVSRAIKEKLLANGADKRWIEDFLSRLAIRPNQPPQPHIDAIAIREIACLWPSLSRPELDHLYIQLLQAATAAQAAQSTTAIVHAHIAEALSRLPGEDELAQEFAAALNPIRAQVLSREALIALTPPLPGERAEQILARVGKGSGTSLLELKMTIAGARPDTIQQAQTLRAQMDFKRQLLLDEGRASSESDLERLAERVLIVANATARRVQLSAATNPVTAARPAEVIAMELLSQPAILGDLDHDGIFQRDGLAIYGLLGHLSDLCRYPWRAA